MYKFNFSSALVRMSVLLVFGGKFHHLMQPCEMLITK